MKLDKWIGQAQAKLDAAGISTARLDCFVLLEDEIGKDRAWLLAHPDFEIPERSIRILRTNITQRSKHIPLAYIRGTVDFFSRPFFVTHAVLVPRPESEIIIELLKNLPIVAQKDIRIADVGCGSGALGITAKLEILHANVDLIDVDKNALDIARKNVIKYATPINIIKSDLLNYSPRAYDVLLCNLPYVPDDFQINTAATHEPRLAIFGGSDGLDIYRRLFHQLANKKNKTLYIITESMPFQHKMLTRIAKTAGFSLEKSDGFVQLFSRLN